jgi:SAM-dependent methyltransferase
MRREARPIRGGVHTDCFNAPDVVMVGSWAALAGSPSLLTSWPLQSQNRRPTPGEKTRVSPRTVRGGAPAFPMNHTLRAFDPSVARTGCFRRWIHEGLRGVASDAPVLAVGCEQAFLAAHLAEYSTDATVLDTSAPQIAQLAPRFPEVAFLPHDLARPLPFPRDTFAAVWCCEFLDRVFDPGAALRELHRILAPGGRLLVTVPDHGAMRNVLIALFRWDHHFAPTNPRIRHFTSRTLAPLARAAGFANLQLATGGAVRRLAGQLVPRSLLLRGRKTPGFAAVRIDRRGSVDVPFRRDELPLAGRVRAA